MTMREFIEIAVIEYDGIYTKYSDCGALHIHTCISNHNVFNND